jgi:hypothetical protein
MLKTILPQVQSIFSPTVKGLARMMERLSTSGMSNIVKSVGIICWSIQSKTPSILKMGLFVVLLAIS